MENPIDHYRRLRLAAAGEALEKNNFDVFVVETLSDAKDRILNQLLPALKPRSVSWGGSMTFTDSGLYDSLKNAAGIDVIDTYDRSLPMDAFVERRRQALLADLFFTGTNAVVETGKLVNLDMIGNRVAALTFGPRNVVVLAGRNKLTPDIHTAMHRIRNYAAPVNAMRLDKKTPCVKTAACEDCQSPERICNTWTITEKSFPAGRIKVFLINQSLGL